MTSNDVVASSKTSLEEKVEAIWREVLDVPEGRNDVAFLDLGGHSIAAVLIASRIEEELGIAVEVADLFDDPTLESFVRDVAARRGAGPPPVDDRPRW